MPQQRVGGAAVGGATRARETRPGGAILVPGYDAAYYLFVTGSSFRIGGAALGGRRQLGRPAAGIAAVPDAAAGAITLQWWWAFGNAVTVRRIDPDGSRVPVRGAEGATPAPPSRFNPSSNPSARDDLTGYGAGSNTALTRQAGLVTPFDGVTTAVRGTASAAGQAAILANLDPVSAVASVYGYGVQTSAVASTLGLSVEWFSVESASLGTTFYGLDAATRTRAAAAMIAVVPTITTFPAGAAFGVLSYVATGLPAGGWVQITGRITESGTALSGPYFDGDSLGAGWVGASGLSYSRLGQLNTVVDAEAPLDTPVAYELTCASVPGWVARTEPVQLDGATVFASSLSRWDTKRRALLTHPGQARTVRVWIENAPTLERDIREAKFRVRGRGRLVVVQAAERDGYESSLDIVTENPDELDRLLDMLDAPSPMLLRLEANLQYPRVWWNSFGKVTIAPAERSGRVPLRKLTVPITEVDRPSVAGRANRGLMGTRDYEAPVVNGRVEPSGLAQTMLLEGHQVMDARAFLVGRDGSSRTPLELTTGSVSCDPASAVRRQASLTVLGRWSPDPSRSRLVPYGERVLVQRGIRVAIDAIEWMTLMTGPVWESDQDDDATSDQSDDTPMTLPLRDEMAMIGRDRFDTNTSTDTSLTVLAQVTAIIRRTLPSASIVDLSGVLGQAKVGKLDMQKDPAGGLMKIATAAGLEVFAGRGFQQFVLRPVPSLDDPPRWVISENNDRANLVKVGRKRTLEGTYNRVFAYGETNDTTAGGTSTPPASGEARITDTADPLYYDGPAGKATRFFSSPLIQTTAQATAAAAGLLAKLRGGNLTTSFDTLVNPALESGDVVIAQLADSTSRHIVDSTGIPLSEADVQSVATRGIDIPDETTSAA